jgi:uncharacterized protein (DUF924 family)
MSTSQIQEVLDFWFATRELKEPTIDSRMERWFDDDPDFNAELAKRFTDAVEQGLRGELDFWAETPAGRLALIILVEQFPRRIYAGEDKAFQGDAKALKLCEQGVAADAYRKLSAIEQMFFFMPLQRAESIKIQQTSVKVYNSLAARVSETMRDTFETVAQFAELRRDIISEFGRFPHRNTSLGRENTGAENEHLAI